MHYIIKSKKNIDEVAANLETNITQNGFGILHMHNLQETMHDKGVELEEACLIYEICNPLIAKEVLNEDMSMNVVLPCRISLYTDKGETKVGMITPSTLMHESSHEEELKKIALSVEDKIKKIINTSV